jgi:FixJ family two-component response regulator
MHDSLPPLVAIVDDDESVRASLPEVVRQFGFRARAFSSADRFLASDCIAETRCLIVDIAMPGMSGRDLFKTLRRRGNETAVIFITSRVDESARVLLLKQGAVECLFKPFSDTALLAALNNAVRPR